MARTDQNTCHCHSAVTGLRDTTVVMSNQHPLGFKRTHRYWLLVVSLMSDDVSVPTTNTVRRTVDLMAFITIKT